MKWWSVIVKSNNGNFLYSFTDENELTAYLNSISALVEFEVRIIND